MEGGGGGGWEKESLLTVHKAWSSRLCILSLANLSRDWSRQVRINATVTGSSHKHEERIDRESHVTRVLKQSHEQSTAKQSQGNTIYGSALKKSEREISLE